MYVYKRNVFNQDKLSRAMRKRVFEYMRAASEGTDQPVHPRSLIRTFTLSANSIYAL